MIIWQAIISEYNANQCKLLILTIYQFFGHNLTSTVRVKCNCSRFNSGSVQKLHNPDSREGGGVQWQDDIGLCGGEGGVLQKMMDDAERGSMSVIH